MTSISNINQFGSIAKLQKLPSATPSETKKVDTKSAAQTHADKKAEGYLQADQIQDLLTLGKVKNIVTQGAPAAVGGMISSFPIEKSIMKKQLKAANEASGGKTEEKKEGNALFNRFRLFPDEDNKYELITGSTLNLMGHFTEGGSVGMLLACCCKVLGWDLNPFEKIAKNIFNPFVNVIKKTVPFLNSPKEIGSRTAGVLPDGCRYAVVEAGNGIQKIYRAGILATIAPWFFKNPVAEVITKDGQKFIREFNGIEPSKEILMKIGEKSGYIKQGEAYKKFVEDAVNGGFKISQNLTGEAKNKVASIITKARDTFTQADGFVKAVYSSTAEPVVNFLIKGVRHLISPITSRRHAGTVEASITSFLPKHLENLGKQPPSGIWKILNSIPKPEGLLAAFTLGGMFALIYNLFEHGAVQIQMPGVSAGKGGAHGE